MSVDDWKKLVDVAGLALLAFTLLLAIASWKIGNAISRRDDAAKLKLEAEVIEAKNRLATQEEKTALAEKSTEVMRRENITRDSLLAESQTEVLNLRGQIATLETNAGEQRERAAKAERSLLELQQAIADRHLTDRQRLQLTALLSASPGKRPIILRCQSGDHESCAYAGEFAAVLNNAGWTTAVEMFTLVIKPTRPIIGMFVAVGNPDRVPVPAIILQGALREVGLEATLLSGPPFSGDLDDSEVCLFIAGKPPK